MIDQWPGDDFIASGLIVGEIYCCRFSLLSSPLNENGSREMFCLANGNDN